MAQFAIGQRVRDRIYNGFGVGTVTVVGAKYIFVKFDGRKAEELIRPEMLRSAR